MMKSKRGRTPDGAPNPIDIYIGKQIRRRRNNLNLSQEQLASQMGITFQQVQKYERGLNRISGSRLWDISQILKVPLNYFFSGIDKEVSGLSPRMMHCGVEPDKESEEFFDAGVTDILYQPHTMALINAYYGVKDNQLQKALYQLLMHLSKMNDEEAQLQDPQSAFLAY